MARTVRDAKLESRAAREKLTARGKPYYRSIDEGLHIGYRKHAKGGGVWVLRRYTGEGAYAVETIGPADDVLDADGATILTFAQAQAKVRERFVAAKRVAAGLSAEGGPYRVGHAIADYIAFLKQNKKTGRDAELRAEALILPELGDVECAKLTKDMIAQWRDRIANTPARLRTKKGKEQRYRAAREDEDQEEAARRRKSSANRTLIILKAALNMAWRDHKIASDETWRRVQPFKQADAARVRYLTAAECSRLINGADEDFRPLVQTALLTGARFGELASLTVADFNPEAGTLHVRRSKSGKARHIVLNDEGVKFFGALVMGKPSHARMLLRRDGGRWGKAHQTRPMREACARAKIDPPASFHVLRHTWASLSVMADMPLMIVARNLGHADTRMVERHYGHLAPDYVAKTIREFAPRFGIKFEGNVTAIGGAPR
jgi:integrase